MRGSDGYSENSFTAVRLEEFVPANRPLNAIRTWVNDAQGQSARRRESRPGQSGGHGHSECKEANND